VRAFADELAALPLDALLARARGAGDAAARGAIDRAAGGEGAGLDDFARLIALAAAPHLERAARAARRITFERFGQTVLLYAPLYLSNECVSTCTYCGFSRENDVARRTLAPSEIADEARVLVDRGLRHILLVTGEHPKATPLAYLCDAVRAVRAAGASSVSIEAAPLSVDEYRALSQEGADGLVVYQETYDRATYARVHVGGKKRDFDWRLGAPERGADGGMRRLGIGALLGLHDWRSDALALAAHAQFLLRRAWRCSLTISVPRLRPAAGGFEPPHPVADRDLAQLLVALRLAFPDAGIVLSTRERAALRDRLVPLGVTQVSAGSRTEPGGYTRPRAAEPQFEVEDGREPEEVAAAIARLGFDPVWKDWEASLHG
jgi:2-iminoacetate synthase